MAEPESPETPPAETGAETPAESRAETPAEAPVTRKSDRSPWNWLLLIPIVVPLLTFIYNHDAPRIGGFPAFYWIQFLFILVGVATTSLVYRMTRR